MTDMTTQQPAKASRSYKWIGAATICILVGLMAYNTTIVKIGSDSDMREQKFSPEAYGAKTFPGIKASVEKRAVDAVTLAKELAVDKKAAGAKYGIAAGIGPVIPVSFTAVVGKRKANYNYMTIAGLPSDMTVRVQTGPALNGTDLRDATGEIKFGQFTNQIEYQDAGSAINNQVKKTVLSAIDPKALTGKTVKIVGVFKLINAKKWLVTPVKVTVQ